ncbi:hemerythrin domain-containing protein [Massilia solisilvae]|uniref:Hemerythrin domain-containing protein n=1 Tax=Massilia solisilvae TaxID=1811225 RepID=A0ABT2BIE7_9BURK|nr:hemerythrin domain-containing protein [Massilia solisilvae]MCS0608286.1 hemerythrin domain-containing protein [Massilia solisilvae]
MNIEKFKHQHLDILASITRLRKLAHAGVAENAAAIAEAIVGFSGIIKLHLAVEDRSLYPALEASGDAALARMSRAYQSEMDGIAGAYLQFAARWNTPRQVAGAPDAFREDANVVLRQLYERIKREDHEFYPAIDAATAIA